MRGHCNRRIAWAMVATLSLSGAAQGEDRAPRRGLRQAQRAAPAPQEIDPEQTARDALTARDKGLAWLAENQGNDGAWGKQYSIAVTSFACLAYLAATDEPFEGPHAPALHRGLEFLVVQQTDGKWPKQGHTWIHGQGFAALALAEAYGRSLLCKTKPDIDTKKLRDILGKAVAVIAAHQSDSGGWWYTPGAKHKHEGSTTVTAVQALVTAHSFGVPIDEEVLAKGFEYLKQCQNRDGGFDYQLGPGETSMKEGTAADVATLALMKKFDYTVMLNAYKFLLKVTPARISRERFPYYGHFYGCMGMKLFGDEMTPYQPQTGAYIAAAQHDVVKWQREDGSWPRLGWMTSSGERTPAYATAFAALLLSVPEARLSIFSRDPPKLPDLDTPPSD